MISPLLLACVGLASQASAACTRDMLRSGTEGYLAALAAGKPTIPALAEGSVPYQENDVVMDISKGVFSQEVAIDFNRSLYDTTLCASYTEVVSTTKHAYVIGTRLAFTDGKITKIESNVCTDKDWLFNVTGSLAYNKRENWDPIPEAQRDSRDVIKAAGDAYIDAWGDATVKPPFNAQCARLEGGVYISSSCKLNFPPPFNVTNRRLHHRRGAGRRRYLSQLPFPRQVHSQGPRNPNQQPAEDRGRPDSLHSREHRLFQEGLREVAHLITPSTSIYIS